ncbi:serine/threonine protein kinase [Aliidiomarina minuta]|uniref:Serine/threonine protein kinase n=1 Tax=Aliidiomarina minuta TaxID=880057 RepID=A0A432W490_9GAMM|nr:phosphotransferase [Aliidiomarina minuta]RUO24305.1 serine/threonine protein kinase [Aliidiomarina minuta]
MHSLNQRQQKLEQWLATQSLCPDGELLVVSGDASFRRYFRYLHQGHWYIAVDAPPPQESLQEFLAIAAAYKQTGVPVPHVYAYNKDDGFMILEDLGDDLFYSHLQDDSSARDYYIQALDLLPGVMRTIRTEDGDLPVYSGELLQTELSLFSDWLLEQHLQLKLSLAEQEIWLATCALLVDNATGQPQVGVHRDYHSRNIMCTESSGLALIDFQDAVLGPVTYDAVSLLRDCYLAWPDELVSELSEHLYQRLQTEHILQPEVSLQQWQRWFDLMGIQRHCKAAGIFARLCHRDGKLNYLADVPRTLNYILEVSAKYPELSDFHRLLKERVEPAVQACAQ